MSLIVIFLFNSLMNLNVNKKKQILTLSLLGYLHENSKPGYAVSKYEKWYIIRKLLCSTFRICKKFSKFAKIGFFFAKSSYVVKMFAHIFFQKMINYTFLKKHLTMRNIGVTFLISSLNPHMFTEPFRRNQNGSMLAEKL